LIDLLISINLAAQPSNGGARSVAGERRSIKVREANQLAIVPTAPARLRGSPVSFADNFRDIEQIVFGLG